MSSRQWSAEQQNVIAEFRDGHNHRVVRARAGVGKTTVSFEGMSQAPERRILYGCFGRKIMEEAKKRNTSPRINVKTWHGVGLGMIRKHWTDVPINMNDDDNRPRRDVDLAETVCGARCPESVKHLVQKLHTKGREIVPHARHVGDLTELMYNFELNPDEEFVNAGFDDEYVEMRALEAMEEAARVEPMKTGIDGADMIFLPVRNHWLHPIVDMVVIDEAQDLTTAQLEIGQGVCRGRIMVVGDDRQAIYAFRGADVESLDRLKRELRAGELPMTMTYRCGKRIVEVAKQLVPDYQAANQNQDGLVITLDKPEDMFQMVQPGDFILSRFNAPLMEIAMKLLRAGKRTKVAGTDIGDGLMKLVRKLRAFTIEDFLGRLKAWEDREANRMLIAGKEKAAERIHDKAKMLVDLCDGIDTMNDLEARIEWLFVEEDKTEKTAILCSSIHKVKGLEAAKVFILTDTLRNNNMEEKNIQYVAITRAIHTLIFVPGIGGR